MSVTVVIPYYREPLERLQRSVDGVLDLGWTPLVVDDSAGAAPPPHEIGCTVIVHYSNRGCAAARNTGIRAAETDLVAVLDCGDVFHETKARQLDLDAPATFSYALLGDVCSRPFYNDWRLGIYRDNQWSASTTVFARDVWEAVGGYDESLRYCDDWDFHMRVQHAIGWKEFPVVTGEVFTYPGGLSDPSRQSAREVERSLVFGRGRLLRP